MSEESLNEVKALATKVSKEEKELERLQRSAGGLKRQAVELEAAIEDAGGARLKGQKALVAKLQQVTT